MPFKTKDLAYYTRQADILVLAAGKMNLVKGDMVKEGAILIDAGINVYQDNIYGDADFESVKDLCSYVTPVPGGVGPVTTAMILKIPWRLLNMQLKALEVREITDYIKK